MRRQSETVLTLTVIGIAATLGCRHDATSPHPAVPPHGIVVLNGYGQPGLTLLADTGAASTYVRFGSDFDGASLTLQHDSVIATSSKAGGDLLYVADLETGAVRKLQMPAASNPAGAQFVESGPARFAVALRDSSAIALVAPSGSLSLLHDAGACPTDVFQYGGALWSVDANANCRGDYASLGPTRLIRIPVVGTERDTIVISGSAGTSSAAVVDGDFAYVASTGIAQFGSTTVASSPGSVAKVDLITRQVVRQLSLPAGSWGATLERGQDGRLYVTAYDPVATFSGHVFTVDPATLTFAGIHPSGHSYRALRTASGGEPNCAAATGDSAGQIYCIEVGAGSATTLFTFDATGAEIRRTLAGQGGVAVALR